MTEKKETTDIKNQMSLKDALTAVQIKKTQQEILDGIKAIRKAAEKADLKYKKERALLAEMKRKKFEGDLMTKYEAMEKISEILADIYSELSESLEGIAKKKFNSFESIFKKYLGE